MEIEDIKTSRQLLIWILPLFSDNYLKPGFVEVMLTDRTGEYDIIQKGRLITVTLREQHRQNDLNSNLRIDNARLANIEQIAKDGSILLRICFFNGSLEEIGDVEVGIDERIVSTARKYGFKFNDIQSLSALLEKKCSIKPDETKEDFYFLLTSGAAADQEFQDDKNNVGDEQQKSTDNLNNHSKVPLPQYRCFCICGDRLRLPVEKKKIDKTKEIFFAHRITSKTWSESDGALKLARGRLKFSDYTKTGQIRALAAGAMSGLLKSEDSYLRRWDEYGAVEGDLLLKEARTIGILHFTNTEKVSNGYKFFFNNSLPAGVEDAELEISNQEPIYIKNPEMSWEQYMSSLEMEFQNRQNKKWIGERRESTDERDIQDDSEIVVAKVIWASDKAFVLDIPVPPDNNKFMFLSLNGDRKQIERRMNARRRILEGRCANPLLGLLIEKEGKLPEITRITNIQPLTTFVKNKIFEHEPTEMQVQAIDIALNTPDIAIIQGPPGTGKTTVISAIIERLNEEHDKTGNIKGEILVSGFQHDAVENIISRLSINSLPTVKFGRRSGDKIIVDAVNERIHKWCYTLAKDIRERTPEVRHTEHQKVVADLIKLYLTSPSMANSIHLLDVILSMPRKLLSSSITEKADSLRNNMLSEKNLDYTDNSETLHVVYSLRVTHEGFADDGVDRAADVFEQCNSTLEETEKDLLKKAITCKDQSDFSFLEGLKTLKIKLLERFSRRQLFRIEKPRVDILEFLTHVSKELDKKSKTSADPAHKILADLLHNIENNPNGMLEAVADYNYVFAATCQQSEHWSIREAKLNGKYGFSGNDVQVTYDTVIIDEAARVSPRDLMIPMTQARKRIILVGDHRQLPHLIDDEVAKAFESGEGKTDFIKTSMFEYLFERLKDLEKQDKFRRTVTLDAQYRMHPLLGNYVNKNFYEIHNSSESFESPLPEHFFIHDLSGTENKPLIWLDVPANCGEEESRGFSRIRYAEANRIADTIKEWIDSEKGKILSYGVISFYKAQVDEIWEALSNCNITPNEYGYFKNEDGEYTDQERLRVGTVDAFQGMEFDVVFLSMVRSRTKLPDFNNSMKNDEKEKIKRKIFGHLMSENRLCVSMSRQKRLLVLVGDSKMLQNDLAREAVPALCNFFDLCKEKGVRL